VTELDRKINEHFSGLVVRKDLVKTVKGNAIVPSYVLEYLMGQYCATSDEDSITTGIETVKEILRKHYVHRNEAGLVRSTIKERGRYKVIDKISVALNEKSDTYEATFSNLGIKKVLVDSDTIKRHPKLLVGGVWCICDLEYEFSEEKNSSPWLMNTIKPIQLSSFDFEAYIEARKQYSTEEWVDLLMQSIGFNPEMFGRRTKLLQLVRLIPFCERNYNLIELGPKGTGKSHIYSEFSPHGILISGGEVTAPKLFVNNTNGKIGLVGYWDVVALDEFAGREKRPDKVLVDILKNYLANKTFSRGGESLGAEASLTFVGNTKHTVPYMLKHSDLFEELPANYHDSAFLDRLHFYIPGWEVDVIRGEMFSNGYGFVVDYLAEILRAFRDHDFSHDYSAHFELLGPISTRDKDGIHKTFSGLMKILYPHGEATAEEIEEILKFAVEGRKRVKDQVMRFDKTFPEVRFGYMRKASSEEILIRTLEEEQYPRYYGGSVASGDEDGLSSATGVVAAADEPMARHVDSGPKEGHMTFQENQRGVSFDQLFGLYLRGVSEITLTDPYIRLFYQARNLMEFLETVAKYKAEEDEVTVKLVTVLDDFKAEQQAENFERIQESVAPVGINFEWTFDNSGSAHARHLVTDTGWKILLDRGLDIFQQYEMNDAFAVANRMQKYRPCKAFEVTYLQEGK
jgi:ATP-dependent Lon protease